MAALPSVLEWLCATTHDALRSLTEMPTHSRLLVLAALLPCQWQGEGLVVNVGVHTFGPVGLRERSEWPAVSRDSS